MQGFSLELVVGIFKQPFFWILIICAIFCEIFYKKFRGFMGEFWLRKELSKLPSDKYFILNNIMIKSSKSTHQIDHIVISKFGIFVIEMKNYYGLITGSEYNDKWIQHLGKNKYYFNNPIHQNYGHIKALEELLNLDKSKFISIICVSNQAKLKTNAKNVINIDYINDFIKSYKKEILDDDLYDITNKIKISNIFDKNARHNHIKNIKDNINESKKQEEEMICPKCGGKLVTRNAMYRKFIGCSNYPICKYTMNIQK